MKHTIFFMAAVLALPATAFTKASVSPILYFMRNSKTASALKIAGTRSGNTASVTVRFSTPPDEHRIEELEKSGLIFKRDNGRILHTRRIYCATVVLDSIDSLSDEDDIVRIESAFRPSCHSTLDVSNPQVQASLVWEIPHESGPIDGTGIIVTNVDTGIDIYHPGFFKPDGDTYEWLDFNRSGTFDPGIDCVDLNGNGKRDPDEILDFFDPSFSDPLGLIERTKGVYDVDIDWLYNDRNRNGIRDFGPDAGYTENDPCFGELLFIVSDANGNNRLDPGERLTALGTSKIIATFDGNGKHYRGKDLLDSLGDTSNHGTGSSGIVGGQVPGRRFTGMAPGVEFISVDRIDNDVEEGIIWAIEMGTHIILYEFASWVYEFLDGTSNMEVLIGDIHDMGIHQFTASGNLAGPTRKRHARLSIRKSETDSLYFDVPDIGITQIYISLLWKFKFLSPAITLVSPESHTFPINGDNEIHTGGKLTVMSGKDVSPKQTNRMDILIESDKPFSGTFTLLINNRRASGTTIDAYLADNATHWMNGAQFQNHVTDDGTVCMPGTAEKGVTVGAYDPRGTRNTRGDINDFSSRGTTVDGRRAVDITAPGTLVYSLTSHDAVGGQPGGYIDFGGTSAALPHVAGCAALILQAAPDLSPDELAEVLFNGALADDFTGDVPNTTWGYGKLRVYDSLYRSNMITWVEEEKEPPAFDVSCGHPNPFNSETSFDIFIDDAGSHYLTLDVFNVLGQKVFSERIEISGPCACRVSWNGENNTGERVASGIYLFRFSHGDISITRNALLLK